MTQRMNTRCPVSATTSLSSSSRYFYSGNLFAFAVLVLSLTQVQKDSSLYSERVPICRRAVILQTIK